MKQLNRHLKIALLVLALIFVTFLIFARTALAQTVTQVQNGGTGTSTVPAGWYVLGSTASKLTATSSGLFSGLKLTGSGTSTAANGFDISSGCYAINGVCATGGGGGGGVNSSTAGYTAYYSSTGATVSGTSTPFLANGRVGLGNTNPLALLHTSPGSGGTGLLLDNNTFVSWRNTSGSLRSLMFLNTANDFVIKTADSAAIRFFNSTGAREIARLNETGLGSFSIGSSTPMAMLSGSTTQRVALGLDQRGTDDLVNLLAAGVRVLTIKASGYLGIGTSTPAALFAGDNGGTADNLIFVNNGTPYTNGYFKVNRYGDAVFKDRYDTKEASYTSGWGIMGVHATSSVYTSGSYDSDPVKIAGSLERVYGRANNTWYIEADYQKQSCGGGPTPYVEVVFATSPTGIVDADGVFKTGNCLSTGGSDGTIKCMLWAGPTGTGFAPGYSGYINFVADGDGAAGCEAEFTSFDVWQN